jgi:hypothetical protein
MQAQACEANAMLSVAPSAQAGGYGESVRASS